MSDKISILNEAEFISELDTLMRQGKYAEMRKLAEGFEDTHGRSHHAATHAMLCNVWRELDKPERLKEQLARGEACEDITPDLLMNMKRELMIISDKYGHYEEADKLWHEIRSGRFDQGQRAVDMIGRAKSLYYRPGGLVAAKDMIFEAYDYMSCWDFSHDHAIPQDVLNLYWWHMQISASSGYDLDTLRCARILVEGTTFHRTAIAPDKKPARRRLARMMLKLDRKPRWLFRWLRKKIMRLARWWDMHH